MPAAIAPKVLVGYDGSDDGKAAIEFAVGEALLRDADLHIVYAIDDTVLSSAWGIMLDVDQVRTIATELVGEAREVAKGFGFNPDRLSGETIVGQPATVLGEASKRAVLLVVGRRSTTGSEGMFTGSTAVGVVGISECPVVVVSAVNPSPTVRHGEIGVGVDPAGHNVLAIEWAMARAQRLAARVRLVAGIEDGGVARLFGRKLSPEQRESALVEAHDKVAALAAPFMDKYDDVDVLISVHDGEPVPVLLKVSQEVDLLILGASQRMMGFGVGGVLRGMMAHAHCPLGIVRHR